MTVNRLPHTDPESTIFVIDDDTSVRKSLSRLLRSLGFNVEAYESGEQFLSREPYQGIGCVILDIKMPGLSGMDLHDELIRTGYVLPIIFVTGHGDIPMSKAIEANKKTKEEQTEHNHTMMLVEQLTPREQEIVPYIISGMLNKQIAFKLGIAEKTVKVHRGRIMEKLCVESVADLVRLAEKVGIEPPDEKR
jgi:two-component system response regulator FixJ